MQERELMERARGGDAEAMEELLALHEKRVYRFGLRMCGTEEDARDVLQETLLSAFRHLHTFRGDAALSTWLYQLARSHCSRLLRKRAGMPDEHLPLDAPAVAAVASSDRAADEISQARQIGEVLQAAILSLPENLRETLILRDVEGLSAQEAAEVVGIEVRALKSRLHRARLRVRAHLAALLEEEAGAGDAGGVCPALGEAIAGYLDEEIDQATCTRIEDHLESCPHCVDACSDLKSTVSLCRSIPGGEVPRPIRSAVRQALSRIAEV